MNLTVRGPKASDEEINRIEELLLTKKYSGKQIGELMGRSKGSVMGIIWRTPKLKAIGFPNPPGFKKKRLPAAKKFVPEPVVQIGPRPLLQLREGQCKFPMWAHNVKPAVEDMLFCSDAQIANSSYCDKHYKLCNPAPVAYKSKLKQVA